MSDLSFFLSDLCSGFLVVWRRVISNGDAIQGITSCLALYFTYKLFFFTRKKPHINLEFNDGKWLLKNVGDLGIKNAKILFLDIKISKKCLLNDGYYGYEEKIVILKDRELLKGKQFSLFDVGIGQIVELNNLFLNLKIDEGINLFTYKEKINNGLFRFEDEIEWCDPKIKEYVDTINKKSTVNEIGERVNTYEQEIEEMRKELMYFIKSISFLEIKIIGDGYNQTIKYMR